MVKVVNITNWVLKPMQGGGVCLSGVNSDTGDEVVQTAEIHVEGTSGGHLTVETTDGTIYRLGTRCPGFWRMALEQQMPGKVAELSKIGVL